MNKEVKQLEMINVTGEPIKHVDIVFTPYTLFLYLIYMPIEEIRRTAFFCGKGLPLDIIKNLPNAVNWTKPVIKRDLMFYVNFCSVHYALLRKFKFLKTADFYGADHNDLYSPIFWGKKIAVVEDGVGLYRPLSLRGHLRLIFHTMLGIPTQRFGRGKHCDQIIYTRIWPLQIGNKQMIQIEPQSVWTEDIQKRVFIQYVFNITNEDLDKFNGKSVILLTQPMDVVKMMTTEQLMDIYRQALLGIDPKKVVIKLHPSDWVDNYLQAFPEYTIMKKPIPMEILTNIGLKIKKAITISSTAIFTMPPDVQRVILDKNLKEKNIYRRE